MTSIRAGLVGVTGYTGMELTRLLAGHPNMRLVRATSRTEAGRPLSDIYPFLRGLPGGDVVMTAPDPDDLAANCDVAFLAVPHGAAMEMGATLRERGLRVVDLSADFRLRDPDVYEAWYKVPHTRRTELPRAVYGLPELYGDAVKKAGLVANPGCYPTATILGLYAALKHGLVETDGIVVDAKSGATGAGRKAAVGTLFCEVSDTFRAYNIGKHRHTPEIEQELSAIAGAPMVVSFNPHLLPINRGILSTIYAKLAKPVSPQDVQAAFEQTWKGSRWVRVLPAGQLPETRHVRGTMFCDVGVVTDLRTGRLVILSAIDNLCRGASGQAVANANLMFSLPVETGLMLAPLMP
ncbi:N-acetyl-gamma-glutamyl-phosphate reductase [Nitratidesulfovibrio liaohensis]|uniref:N-acetyl-gamma-glutamyl-phosphate reductase n=1 Tax=Nitratidesulfovibrio liaohensis TaxID=2604158 RepID=A0ABY9QYN6_9BACT|nr:N-acetyl-gamma-glutamyl-phosphate reductase [Nitratidesulfovibrio liaohensis]WMW63987.1 N-acetyl-gamma-glutamyl-phosphate reductase [Nitratidesulfovibrio liaohensis]